MDRQGAVAMSHLGSFGVEAILLKGPVIAAWLYDDGELRSYCDVDLLVSPADFERATAALGELGFVNRLVGAHPIEHSVTERELVGPDNVNIDLHRGLIGVKTSFERCWEVLRRQTVTFSLASYGDVLVLDEPARLMHLPLHAAQNGPADSKALDDLGRGLAKANFDAWREAAAVAERLDATEAFAAGLRLLPAGEVLAEALTLPRSVNVELYLRTRSAPSAALFFEKLAATAGLSAKIALIRRKLFPTAVYLGSQSTAGRVRAMALVRPWARRAISLATRLLPAFRSWNQARRYCKGRSGAEISSATFLDAADADVPARSRYS